MKRAWSRKNLWDRCPDAVRNLVGRLTALVPPAWFFGRDFRTQLRFLDETQWRPAEWFHAWQLDRLRKICALAARASPFYRDGFKVCGFDPRDLKSLADFRKLPQIDKETVNANREALCTVSPRARGVDYVSTGGTSGVPLHFYMGAGRSPVEWAYLVASWRRVGYDLGVPLAVFRGRIVSDTGKGFRHQYDPVLRHHYYSTFHMTDLNMERSLNHIRRLGPCFLHVYPSSADTLAHFILRSGTAAPRNICGIIAESEIVYPEQRTRAEAVFGCRYFSCYGHTEKLVLAAECEYSCHYHVWPTYGYFELLDDRGHPVTTPGETGQIVGTGFLDTVTPFIRYRTGDYATYVADRCPACGREHPIITDIRGHRVQEVLVAEDGTEIPWTAMNMHDDTFLRVRQFQFFQDKPGRAVLRIVPADGFGQEDCKRILQNLGAKFDGRLCFGIELRTSIALSPRGKAIFVDQKIPADQRGARGRALHAH